MSNEVEFRNKAAFLAWIGASGDVHRYRFGRLFGSTLIVRAGDLAHVTENGGSFVPIELPDPNDADVWWERYVEGDVIDYWVYKGGGEGTVICAAKASVWRPHDSLHAELHANDFTLIGDDEFQQVVGHEIAHAMWNEVRLVGFSVRRLLPRHTAAERPHKTHKDPKTRT